MDHVLYEQLLTVLRQAQNTRGLTYEAIEQVLCALLVDLAYEHGSSEN